MSLIRAMCETVARIPEPRSPRTTPAEFPLRVMPPEITPPSVPEIVPPPGESPRPESPPEIPLLPEIPQPPEIPRPS